jgi:hypothetical protein
MQAYDEGGVIVPRRLEFPMRTSGLERFRSDFQRRYSEPTERSPSPPADHPANAEEEETLGTDPVRLRRLPPEAGVLLTVVGTAGLVLPGVVGAPFLLAGGIALWPKGFRKLERWLMKAAPGMYETGVQQIEQFVADLERRYPDQGR